MMTGASMMMAKANATPNAARLTVGSARRAMNAARYGPSIAIISQVLASGSQKRRIVRGVSGPAVMPARDDTRLRQDDN